MTRRCSERRCFLVPSEAWVAEVFSYLLAALAPRHGILVHCVCVMSNHWHIIFTDTTGNLPLFAAQFHRLCAAFVNRKLQRREAMWAQGSYSLQELPTPTDIIDDCAYVITNPVAAGCVKTPERWPGLITLPSNLCSSSKVQRPEGFFRDKGPLPQEATLELTPPPGFEPDEFRQQVREAAERRTASIEARFVSEGRSFMGPGACKALKVGSTPSSPEPFRQANPRVKCLDPELKERVLSRLKRFWRHYRLALEDFRAGLREVEFPFGTFWLRRHLGVCCCQPPPDEPLSTHNLARSTSS